MSPGGRDANNEDKVHISVKLDLYYHVSFFMPSLILMAASSTKGIKRLTKAERAEVELPEEIKDVLVGILLGDGLAQLGNNKLNT